MKKILFLLYLMFGLSLNAQIISFSDSNFKAKILTANTSNGFAKDSFGNNIVVDANGNGEIEVSEALNVYELYLWSDFLSIANDIVNLDGIQSFQNLKKLNCFGNSIINLDLQGLNNLESIEAGENNISSANFSGLTSLQNINLNFNELTSINIDNLTNLRTIFIYSNQLTSLTFNNNSSLENVWCSDNLITSLDFSATLNLKSIDCNSNRLTSINLGAVNSVIEFYCSNNNITNLDISNLSNLSRLNISNNPISSLNLNSLSKLNQLYASNTLVTDLDCSQTAVQQLYCSDNPNIKTINVKNNVFTFSDPGLLYYGFVIENNPQLISICLDEGEQNSLSYNNFSYNTSGNVIVYAGPTCSKIVVPKLAVKDLTFQTINNSIVFPNPTNTVLNISTNDKNVIHKATIYNTLGQLIKIINNSSRIDVSELKAGTYFISIESENGKSTQKFIKF